MEWARWRRIRFFVVRIIILKISIGEVSSSVNVCNLKCLNQNIYNLRKGFKEFFVNFSPSF